MKFLAKLGNHLRKIGKKGKIAICTAIAAIGTAAMTVCASAAEIDQGSAPSLGDTVATVGDNIAEQFNAFVNSLIPVMIAILMSGLGIYAVFSLIKFAKKIFNHVAG